MEYTNLRKKIDYEQVRMEAKHLQKQVENDFLERQIQDKIRLAKLALDLKIGQYDRQAKAVDNRIQVAQQMRGKQNLFGMAPFLEGEDDHSDNWSDEEQLWETYKQNQ